mmetsp:Transcript_73676/g.177853  ORF Transcript_73676/g.177853 Transcript_73676/m.177853 type:complete len:246 (-) Transcript_73676:121-858(-)
MASRSPRTATLRSSESMAATGSAVSTSPPGRPPPSPAAVLQASATASAPASCSATPGASRSTRPAPSRSSGTLATTASAISTLPRGGPTRSRAAHEAPATASERTPSSPVCTAWRSTRAARSPWSRIIATITSAASTSPPGRSPPSLATAPEASATVSAPTPISISPGASTSPGAAVSPSLRCAWPAPRVAPSRASPPRLLAHAVGRTDSHHTTPHRASLALLSFSASPPPCPQDTYNHRIRRVE